MNTLDWVILGVLGVGFIVGFIRGVIRQAFSLGGLILGIILGTLLYRPFAGLLQNVFSMQDQTAKIIAFIVILLVVPIVCGLLGKLLSKLVHAANLGLIDCLAGALFGILKYMIVMGLVIKLLDFSGVMDNVIRSSEREESKLYGPVCGFTGFCLQWTWNKVQGTADDLIPDLPQSDDNTKTEKKKV
jgi:membrane protein required for colicin V production